MIASSLNPLTISHIAKNTSFNIIGRWEISNGMAGLSRFNKTAVNIQVDAIIPHADIKRGMSLN